MLREITRYFRVRLDTSKRNEALTLANKLFGSPERAQIWLKSSLYLGVTPLKLIEEGKSKLLLEYMERIRVAFKQHHETKVH